MFENSNGNSLMFYNDASSRVTPCQRDLESRNVFRLHRSPRALSLSLAMAIAAAHINSRVEVECDAQRPRTLLRHAEAPVSDSATTTGPETLSVAECRRLSTYFFLDHPTARCIHRDFNDSIS